jgi:serine-type D-Ala-D-Ala carboxypeptidase (penicillin-binding protein 5/6)
MTPDDTAPNTSSPAPDSLETTDETLMLPSAHIPVFRQLTVAVLFLVIIFGTTLVSTIATLTKHDDPEKSDILVEATLPVSLEEREYADPFHDVEIVGKAAFVWDVTRERVLFNKNGDDQLPIASITKLMTALVSYELLDPEEKVAISRAALKTEGDSGFVDAEKFTTQDLIDLTLMSSSNDGAAALGLAASETLTDEKSPYEVLFVEAMNVRAREIGLKKTVFYNPTGLDTSKTEAGALSSARDVAYLMEYVITNYPEVTALTAQDSLYVYNDDGAYHSVSNTNQVVDRIDGLIASKTGTTPLAGGNLVIAFNAGLNRPIVVVVLGSTEHERFTDILTLSERARKYTALFSE